MVTSMMKIKAQDEQRRAEKFYILKKNGMTCKLHHWKENLKNWLAACRRSRNTLALGGHQNHPNLLSS
jgi:hypothetical protein